MTTINLDGVETWATGAILPPGRHTVRIESAEDTTSKGGNPQVEMSMSAVGGEHAGLGIRDWLTLTAAALGRVRQFLEAAQVEIPEGDFDFPTASLPGRVVGVLVRKEPKQDGSGDRTVVAAYMPADADSELAADTTGMNGAGSATEDPEIPFRVRPRRVIGECRRDLFVGDRWLA